MCDVCNKLKGVPKDKKATVMLLDKVDDVIDASVFRVFMQLNHEDDGTPYAFIKQDVEIESTGRSYGTPIYITHCPFCGDKLC